MLHIIYYQNIEGSAGIAKVLIRLMLKKCSRSNSWWFGLLGALLYCGEILTRYG